MDTISWHMNATQGGANLHPGVNLLLGANCAHEHGLSVGFSLYRIPRADTISNYTHVRSYTVVSMDQQTYLSLALSETPNTRFPTSNLKLKLTSTL